MSYRSLLMRYRVLATSPTAKIPVWVDALKATPPPRFPLKAEKPKEIVFPEDILAREFERRNRHVSPFPVGHLPRISVMFAREQLKMMQGGVTKEDAYNQLFQQWKAGQNEALAQQEQLREAMSQVALQTAADVTARVEIEDKAQIDDITAFTLGEETVNTSARHGKDDRRAKPIKKRR